MRVHCPHCNSATQGLHGNPHICGHCKKYIGDNEALSALYKPKSAELRRMMKEKPAPEQISEIAEGVCKDIREAASERAAGPKPRIKWVPEAFRHLLEICVMDAHLGKLAWAEETGENYDIRIASDRVRDAVTDLLYQARAFSVERILLPWGNDFFHYDTLEGTTTAGTQIDRDSRYQKMFRCGRALASEVVLMCAEVAPVELLIVPGNHDEITAFTHGEVLAAEFKDDPRVTVRNEARPRKYVRYGKNLLGFCHGHSEPHNKLPMTMAVEEPELWAMTRYREWHLGHLHTSKRTDARPVDSVNGVRVRILQSLSGIDAWHAKNAYVGETGGCEAFVWNYEKGLRANLFHLLPEAA